MLKLFLGNEDEPIATKTMIGVCSLGYLDNEVECVVHDLNKRLRSPILYKQKSP